MKALSTQHTLTNANERIRKKKKIYTYVYIKNNN